MARTNPNARMHAQRTHIHRAEIITTMSRSLQAGSTKMKTSKLNKYILTIFSFSISFLIPPPTTTLPHDSANPERERERERERDRQTDRRHNYEYMIDEKGKRGSASFL